MDRTVAAVPGAAAAAVSHALNLSLCITVVRLSIVDYSAPIRVRSVVISHSLCLSARITPEPRDRSSIFRACPPWP